MSTVTANDVRTEKAQLRDAISWHVTYSLGMTADQLTPREMYRAVALAVRDRMVEQMLATQRRYQQADSKRLYYLSLEFLIGRSLHNNLVNLELLETCKEVLAERGFDLGEVEDTEVDAALGNGGLGRLAACFLDSLATLDLPGFGYGINYEYGLFKQEIRNNQQYEKPDNWRMYHPPWELEASQDAVLVPLYGRIEHATDRFGNYNPMWLDWQVVIGVPHDMPIVGYGGATVNYLRLYSARASQEFDMSIFNVGDYINAVHDKVQSETISKVLYPSEAVGRELRLVQEYFLVACALRDIIRRYSLDHAGFDRFADKVAIQLNDTHPALTVVELMRILVDENEVPWEKAWDITTAVCAYTNHTLLPEALERWPVSLFERVLPRHLQIIYEINQRFLKTVAEKWPGDTERLRAMSLIEEGEAKQVRMAYLSIVGSHSVNGVAEVHSHLVQTELVPYFYQLWPERFNNKTNGVTPRRWLLASNPGLAELITETIGNGWITDLDQLRELDASADDAAFQKRFLAVKRSNKQRLARVVRDTVAETIDCDGLFDVQVKRIHEYKRQLLNVLHIVHEYLRLVEDGQEPTQPRTYVFAGKAAPGYQVAKQVIRLINDVARVINTDRRANGRMKVVFVPDYRVTLAEVIMPAADLSEQVSTAGTEASGTGNMKFAMNGALTIGTLDGANIEIREEVGPENIFIFGLTVAEIRRLRTERSYHPAELYRNKPAIKRILDAIKGNCFCPRAPGQHDWVYQRLLVDGETYFHLADLESYLAAHDAVGRLYRDPAAWAAKAIRNVARIGKFSSDRTIREYARDIWDLTSVTTSAQPVVPRPK
jgi:starch phosphorylase